MQIRNLGPIKNLEIDLNKMNVFVGKNGVGKTIAAYAIYLFFDWFNKNFLVRDLINHEEIKDLILRKRESISFDIDELEDKIAEQASEQFNALPFDYFDNFFNHTRIYTNKSEIKITLGDIKAFEISKNLRHGWYYSWNYIENKEIVSNTQSVNTENTSGRKDGNEILAAPDNDKIKLTYTVKSSSNNINYVDQLNEFENNIEKSLNIINLSIQNVLFRAFSVPSDPIYLPAERIGINVFRNDLNLTRLNISSGLSKSLDSSNNNFKKYAFPIESYIGFVNNNINNLNRDVEKLDNNKLISKLIPGSFNYDEDHNNVNYKLPGTGNSSEVLDFETISSSLKSIFGLDLFLKSYPEGRWLFFDEPEMNLHPENQKIIADLLFKLMKKNIKFVISTHSDYFTKELINCVLKDRLDGQENNEINVYEFKDGTATKINNIFNIDEPVNNFDDTTREINKEYYKLVDELEPEDDLEDFQEEDDE